MDSPNMSDDIVTTSESSEISIKLSPGDRFDLLSLQTNVRIKRQELDLARLSLETSQLLSDALADKVIANLGLPSDAVDITLDLNDGTVRYSKAELVNKQIERSF